MDEEQQDFAARLTMIESEANLVLEDLAPGTLRDVVQNVATVARLLRLRLEVASGLILPARMNEERADFGAKLALIEAHATRVLGELRPSVVRDRVQHIATLASLLRQRLGAPPDPSAPGGPKR